MRPLKYFQKLVQSGYTEGITRCNTWGVSETIKLNPQTLLDVGCGDGSRLRQLIPTIKNFYGIEAAINLAYRAKEAGLTVFKADLNSKLPFSSNMFDVVHSAQVIEHLHNTRMFVEEIYRVLKPGGTALISSENLTSFLNLGAVVLGYTPFSLMQICGWSLGNPLGLHYKKDIWDRKTCEIGNEAFAGITGHIRVLSALQALELFSLSGFKVSVKSLGLMPLPQWLGQILEKWLPRRGHFLMIRATKPL